MQNHDLWSTVTDQVIQKSQAHSNRVSTRRALNQRRETLVNMLQSSVVPGSSSPHASVQGSASDATPPAGGVSPQLPRPPGIPTRRPIRHFASIADYLASFITLDDTDTDLTPSQADALAEKEAEVHMRIDVLRRAGRLTGKQSLRPAQEPPLPSCHHDMLIGHVLLSSRLIRDGAKARRAGARRVAKAIERFWETLRTKGERDAKEEERRMKKLAKWTAGEVRKKWRVVEKVIEARHREVLQEEQQMKGKRHLEMILEHSTQMLGVRQEELGGRRRGAGVGVAGMSREGSQELGSEADEDAMSLDSEGVEVDKEDEEEVEDEDLEEEEGEDEDDAASSSMVFADQEDADAASVSEAPEEEDDGEFVADAGAAVEDDDETTLAMQDESSDDDDELKGLEDERDMPIELLMKKYAAYRMEEGDELEAEAETEAEAEESEDEEEAETAAEKSEPEPESGPEPEPIKRQKRAARGKQSSMSASAASSRPTSPPPQPYTATGRRRRRASNVVGVVAPAGPDPDAEDAEFHVAKGEDGMDVDVVVEEEEERAMDADEEESGDDDEELEGLEEDQDVPIEVLLKRYGYRLDEEEGDREEEDEEDEVEEQIEKEDKEEEVVAKAEEEVGKEDAILVTPQPVMQKHLERSLEDSVKDDDATEDEDEVVFVAMGEEKNKEEAIKEEVAKPVHRVIEKVEEVKLKVIRNEDDENDEIDVDGGVSDSEPLPEVEVLDPDVDMEDGETQQLQLQLQLQMRMRMLIGSMAMSGMGIGLGMVDVPMREADYDDENRTVTDDEDEEESRRLVGETKEKKNEDEEELGTMELIATVKSSDKPTSDDAPSADSVATPPVGTTLSSAAVKTRVPFLLRGNLREYQHVGLDWLASLYNNGLNGILADEMGLGKTIQTIALLAHLACERGVWGPHLIVVPTSVMLNWEMEFKRWLPGFKILTYYGSPRERKEKRVGWSKDNSFHVCITSYQLVCQDQNIFRRKAWHFLILDEAHNIKNFRSQRWQVLLNFNAYRRLLLTGTPLQNNLMELWSLLYFLMPNGVSQSMPIGFANQKEFQDWFSHPVDRMIENNQGMDDETRAAIQRLHTVLRPYLLRRLKADVEKQMPLKYEHIVYCRLSKRQRFLYDDFMSRAKTRETLASGNFLSIINCLMQLRKVCNHPDLFEVRPIVTSFSMSRAVHADYEVKELLVRRRLLRVVDEAREKVDLPFMNLVLGETDEKMSRIAAESYDDVDTAQLFLRERNKHMGDAVEARGVAAQHAANYYDLKQHAKAMQQRARQATARRWERMGYVNGWRCGKRPLYGLGLIDMCRNIGSKGCADAPVVAADPRRYLDYTNALASAVVSYKDRVGAGEEILKRYAFVTPKVVVRPPAIPAIASLPPEMQVILRDRVEDIFHPIDVRLQIAFPDKWLLQFDCGKLQKLDGLLRDLKAGGHRALIFTQMTRVLDILEIFLNIHGYRYLRLDGATKVEQRQFLTERFNNDKKILVFILSTRSGGLGINLTGADTVVFYDSDWNPCMDHQCQDRCHRIGQTRDVHIYRFVTEFTIEENIYRKANQKRMLDNVVITEGEFTTDYFQKIDWRDMLDPEDLPESVRERSETAAAGVDIEQALLAAEDESDAQAARIARREMDLDVTEFAETTAPLPGVTDKPGGLNVDSPARLGAGDASARVLGALAAEGGPLSGTLPAVADDQEQVIGHVDEYMLRFAEREFGVYLGFGGLANPDSSIAGIGASAARGPTKPLVAGPAAPTIRSKSASVPTSTISFSDLKERDEEDERSSVVNMSEFGGEEGVTDKEQEQQSQGGDADQEEDDEEEDEEMEEQESDHSEAGESERVEDD
ncbi:SNF2 family N-terminal domain-containing protein [Jimgerdemannia flammicorona]|uniref:Helicase SWR1 n=1 Tax=Jimgerdemannia flammicorona TaxID=994334 RepID=A0A433Q875_9FUNG|nr:SNF2 family N-terminal domain-containing protein [Jimgerdemannia flammicorona]